MIVLKNADFGVIESFRRIVPCFKSCLFYFLCNVNAFFKELDLFFSSICLFMTLSF